VPFCILASNRMFRLIGLVAMFAIAGTPAARAICGLACGATGSFGAAHDARRPDVPGVAAPAPAGDLAHQHHQSPHAGTSVPPAAQDSAARVADGNCCGHEDRALPSRRAALRVEGDPLTAAAPVESVRAARALVDMMPRATERSRPKAPPAVLNVLRI
jgi:hypothetical protein